MDARHVGLALLDERDEVGVGDLLLGVGERDGRAVDRVELLALDLVAQLAELALEPAAAGELADRQRAARQPDRLRGHDLVGERVLEVPVLVDAGLVREGVGAHDRLVRLDREAGQVADTRREAGVICSVWTPAARSGNCAGARPQGHDDLFEARVARALAEAVDRDLDLAGAGLDRGQRVGRREAQVVVAVDADDRVRRRSALRRAPTSSPNSDGIA